MTIYVRVLDGTQGSVMMWMFPERGNEALIVDMDGQFEIVTQADGIRVSLDAERSARRWVKHQWR